MKPSPDRITDLVIALNELKLRPLGVDMRDYNQPSCNTPGCHAGLLYQTFDMLGIKSSSSRYSYSRVALDITRFLFEDHDSKLKDGTFNQLQYFASYNPEWWGNRDGLAMFVGGRAFNMKSNSFADDVIIDWWNAVESRNHMLGGSQ
jgi:hypothetical protein